MAKKVSKRKFLSLCKKYNLGVEDLPFMLPKDLILNEKKLELLLKSISEAKPK